MRSRVMLEKRTILLGGLDMFRVAGGARLEKEG
jgi:hypothetical protein